MLPSGFALRMARANATHVVGGCGTSFCLSLVEFLPYVIVADDKCLTDSKRVHCYEVTECLYIFK